MNSRQRVLAAIDHKEPDKIPIDLGGTICTTASATANKKLKEFLKIDKGGEIITHPLLDVILPLPEILDLFETDCRTVRLKSPTSEDGGEQRGGYVQASLSDKPQGHSILDENGTTWKKCGYDYSPVSYPLQDATLKDIEKFPWPDPYNAGRTKGLREEAKKLREDTDFCIMSDIMCGGPYENALWVRGFNQFPMDMLSDQKIANAILDKITELDIGFWDVQLSAVGDLVDVVCQGDDMGMQTSMQISPEIYRKLIKPYHKKLFSFIRSKTDARIWLHSCGSVYDIIPDLIELGIQVLNPVQCSARNMGLAKLKKEFGKDMAFWGGGFNVQKIPFMTQEEIKESVKKTLYTMAPGGGYIFAGTHNILPETKGESIYTAYMTAREYRDYSKLV